MKKVEKFEPKRKHIDDFEQKRKRRKVRTKTNIKKKKNSNKNEIEDEFEQNKADLSLEICNM